MALSRDQILAADDLPTEEVDVPEWGGSVRVGTLNVRDRLAFEARVTGKTGADVLFDAIISMCVGDDGSPLFTPDDLDALFRKNPEVLMRVGKRALTVNKLGTDDVEELAKNSEASPSADSSSGSRHLSE